MQFCVMLKSAVNAVYTRLSAAGVQSHKTLHVLVAASERTRMRKVRGEVMSWGEGRKGDALWRGLARLVTAVIFYLNNLIWK